MSANGDYLAANGKLVSNARLEFWGEWEPPSRVVDLGMPPDPFHPRWLHFPFLPMEIPANHHQPLSACLPSSTGGRACASGCGLIDSGFQNTDPFVFGDCFKYFVCKQSRKGRPTKMADLNAGSVVLFGSTSGRTRNDAIFQLDTVFVVAGHFEYRPCDPASLPKHPLITDDYLNAVFRTAFPEPNPNIPADLKLRLYLGATVTNPVHGMYSFAPARVAGVNASGFPRVPLKDLPYLTNNLNSAPKFTDCAEKEAVRIWREIRDISRKHGCVEGVRFTYEKDSTAS